MGAGPFVCPGSRHNLAMHEHLALSTFAPRWVSGKPGRAPSVLSVSNEWMTDGDCLDSDPDLFHADHQGVLRRAARICTMGPCPVIDTCLRYALDRMDDGQEDGPDREIGIGKYGVWGGTLPIDRWRMLDRRSAYTGRAA